MNGQFFVRLSDLSAFMSRLSCVHDQIFVRSPDYLRIHGQTLVRSSDFSCVHFQTFVHSSDLSCVHFQTIVRSCPDFRASTRFSCVHLTFVRSPDFPGFMIRLSCAHHSLVRSRPDFRAFTRFLCVHQIFVRSCPDTLNFAQDSKKGNVSLFVLRCSCTSPKKKT